MTALKLPGKWFLLGSFLLLLPLWAAVSKSKLPQPPGMVPVGDSLFMDQREISNRDYQEFLYFMDVRFFCRRNKDLHKYLLLDTLVLMKYSRKDSVKHFFNYFRHPSSSHYPLIGVSYDQAIQYCRWRTDRVYLRWLLDAHRKDKWEDKILKDTCQYGTGFTAEWYINGKYMGLPLDTNVPVPVFMLPTKAEWERIARPDTLANNSTYPDGSIPPKLPYMDLQRQAVFHPWPTMSGKPNKAKIYNLYGNVAEMVAEKGVAMGGAWTGGKEIESYTAPTMYEFPEAWIGFRCVCRLMTYSQYKKFLEKQREYAWKGAY